ncbi:MAG: phage scaffolding protein [Lachnospiraceae bacterium]|nr:phage scaffolding protein [Lachnospiraceae bacterium]
MKRKELEEMGLTKEQVDKIMKDNGEDIENAKSSLQTEIKSLQTQVSERDTQLESLKKSAGDNEALTKQIAELQAANTKAAEAHEAEMNQLKLDVAVEKALTGANTKNVKAVKALLDLDDAKFDRDGNIKGLQEQIEKLSAAEDTKFLFDAKEPPKTQFKGFQPGTSTTVPNSKQAGYETRLAEARKNNNQLEAIQIKQEAAADGVILM